jgi:hypothetical protein
VHDWHPPAAHGAERVIDELEWRIESARDELVVDLHAAAKRLGCSHYFDHPSDPLSIMFSAYDAKVEKAMSTLRKAVPLDEGRRQS